MPDGRIDAADEVSWVVFICVGGTLVISAVLLEVVRRYGSEWALHQILEDPKRRLRPLRWMTNVAFVVLLAFFFDKINVSRTLEGQATSHDITFSSLTALTTMVYAYALAFLWKCENALERSLTEYRRDLTIARAKEAGLVADLDNERRLANQLNQITGERWQRLTGLLDGPETIELPKLAAALDPDRQSSLAIVGLHAMVRAHFRGGLEPEHQLRLAYYEPDGSYLSCVASFDGRKAGCIRNPNGDLRDSFKLEPNRATKCLAVHCALNAPFEPFMIGDADAADRDTGTPYSHLTQSQKEHIKSIAAFSCRRAGVDQPPHAVITLDCTRTGFFADTPANQLGLRRILDEFSLRLAYERDVKNVLARIEHHVSDHRQKEEISA